VKYLLPLVLLTIVTYVSLWYPYKDATARISFGVTGILTGAVMLNSVTSSLPSVDDTVAIEWAYYAFITLAHAGCETFVALDVKGGLAAVLAHVGACTRVGCVHNVALECTADTVRVGSIADPADCLTYTAR
jgi:hypothetical protein